MCGFSDIKAPNPHMWYIYVYHYHHWDIRFYMHASISVGYIYVINEMLNIICMHSILMIEDYVYIYEF